MQRLFHPFHVSRTNYISSRSFRNSEAFASEFLKDLEHVSSVLHIRSISVAGSNSCLHFIEVGLRVVKQSARWPSRQTI